MLFKGEFDRYLELNVECWRILAYRDFAGELGYTRYRESREWNLGLGALD